MIINPYIFSTSIVYDADAQAFFDAIIADGGSLTVTEMDATNTLVVGLKADGLWTPMRAIYPYVGGTATSHKYNLKDPRNLDIAFRLLFAGGWTHSATGAKGNGTNAYANTYLNPTVELTTSSIGIYCRTVQNINNIPIGAYQNISQAMQLNTYSNNFIYYYSGGISTTEIKVASTNIYGMLTGSTQATNNRTLHLNNSLLGTNVNNTPFAPPNYNFYIGARNTTGSPSNYSTIELGMAHIANGLTNTNVTDLYSRVQTFQTTLGRQV